MDQKPNIFYKNFAKLCQEKKTVNKCLKENLYYILSKTWMEDML